MRKQYLIDKTILANHYNGRIPILGENFRLTDTIVDGVRAFQAQKLELMPESVCKMWDSNTSGVFQVKELMLRGQTFRYLFLDKSLLEVIELPDTEELVTPVLEKLMKGRYRISRDGVKINVDLYYPTITLTNTAGGTHTVTDLVVRVILAEDNRFFEAGIRGKRLTFTKQEWDATYTHSHLPKSATAFDDNFNLFCLGTSAFNTFISKSTKQITADSFALFVMQLHQYLSWESLEGKPHISMSNISSGTAYVPTYNMGTDTAKEISRKILFHLTDDMLSNNNGKYVLNPITCEKKLFDIETKVAMQYADSSITFKYNVTQGVFVSTASSNSNRVPSLEQIKLMPVLGELAKHFNVAPAIRESVATTQAAVIVKRFAPNCMVEIIKQINILLYDAAKVKLNESIGISVEGENNHHAAVSSAS